MDWRLKSVAFRILGTVPFGNDAYYYAQKFVTKRSRSSLSKSFGSDKIFPDHLTIFRRYFDTIDDAVYLEFGAGRYLFDNLLNYCYGINRQIVIDVKPLARQELINRAIIRLMGSESPDFVREPQHLLGKNFVGDLKSIYGIEYLAPADARNLSFPDGSIDIIATTNTLEHIPASDLELIVKECYRLCNNSGVVSMKIDYKDHYSHTDEKIGPYNFLSFSETTWRLFSPSNHFQNRMRHNDYEELFTKSDFRIVEQYYEIPETAAEDIGAIRLSKKFKAYEVEDLMKIYGHFVLRKAGSG